MGNLIIFTMTILFILFFYIGNESGLAVIFAQTNEEKIITIPKGSANPEVDMTKFTLKQWYKPARNHNQCK